MLCFSTKKGGFRGKVRDIILKSDNGNVVYDKVYNINQYRKMEKNL